jgi:hypothetical protein
MDIYELFQPPTPEEIGEDIWVSEEEYATIKEVDEVEEYANLILELRKNDALATINKDGRENWVF